MRRRAVLADAADITISGPQDVQAVLAAAMSQVRRGELDVRVANCLGQLASVALRAIDQGDTERRVRELEEQLAKFRGDFDA
jgi:hypothetical protein